MYPLVFGIRPVVDADLVQSLHLPFKVLRLIKFFSVSLFLTKKRSQGPENVEYAAGDAEGFRYAYRTHFSDSFYKVFSEVVFQNLSLIQSMVMNILKCLSMPSDL